jgi:hypothetical protein
MRIWFDTTSPMPHGYDRHCRSARAALASLRTGLVTSVSIGYDHATGGIEALALAIVIESMAASAALQPITWRLHAQATADTAPMVAALRAADQHWKDRQATTVAVTRSGRLTSYCPTSANGCKADGRSKRAAIGAHPYASTGRWMSVLRW